MQFEVQATEDDFVQFNNYHYKYSPVMKRQVFLSSLLLAVSVLVATTIVNLIVTDGMAMISIGIGVCAGIFMFFITPSLMYWSVSRNAKKLFREGKNIAMTTLNRYEFTPEGINYHSAITSGSMTWQAIEKVEASSDTIYIYVGSVSALMLPRRLFNNDQEFQETLHRLQSYKQAAPQTA